MMTALYSGATGMKVHDTGLSTVSNNIANVNTIGFKQQYTLFQDLMSQSLAPGASWAQNVNQLGLGAQVGAIRTVFTEGSFEPGSEGTDLAIGGKGYFQVSDGKDTFYTRAGNFRFDAEGWLRTPAGMTVTGMDMNNGHITGGATPIRIDPKDPNIGSSPAKATSNLTAALNVPRKVEDNAADPDNPFFSLISEWNGAVTGGVSTELAEEIEPPLSSGSYSDKQTLKIIDASGTARELTLYLDGVSSETSGSAGATYEYLLAANPLDTVAEGGIPDKNAGALMIGTITFSPSGDIADMTAFTPTGAEDPAQPLSRWVPAPMVNGKPQFQASFEGNPAQSVALDLGVTSATNLWSNPPASAAAVGKDRTLLGSMDSATKGERASFASASTTGVSSSYTTQDGYIKGDYTNMEITPEGIVRVNYSNAQSADLYTIPLYRFTSEDGLRREGGNLYSAAPEAGETQWGVPGTNNFGTIQASQLESSNVDMAREMVSLITMQRGFQMNSKTVTTADQLLQKAMELKRN